MFGRSKRRSATAIRVVVRYGGDVVEERLVRSGETLDAGGPGTLSVPSPTADRPLVCFQWRRDAPFAVVPGDEAVPLEPETPWRMHYGDVEIEAEHVDLVRIPKRRLFAEGDLALLVMMLAMTVFFGQFDVLMKLFAGASPGDVASRPAPTAELIARLLAEDHAGEDVGVLTQEVETAVTEESPLFLPTGHAGPLTRTGGAERTGPAHTRGEPDGGEGAVSEPQVEASAGRQEEADPTWETVEDGLPLPLADEVAQRATDEPGTPEPRSPEEGWGFSDWYEGAHAQREASEIRGRIRFARELLAIDPDSDWALQTLAYYQYLSQDYSSTLETYQRFIGLYPDDPSGYNNIALVYKRIGDYSTEEAYYRRALALESLDVHALNNLAVNLSHQKRFDEALSIMEVLAVLDPGEPYAELHRAKIYAEMGKVRRAYSHLERALSGMAKLDTLHHIEFRQDIRVDPSFRSLRKQRRFSRLLKRYYGDEGARGLAGDIRG